MKYTFLGASDVGQVREVNEDSFTLAPEIGLLAVADGMGGYKRGDLASALACNVVRERILESRDLLEDYRRDPSASNRIRITTILESSLQSACEEVNRAGGDIGGEGSQIGTTMDVVLLVGATAFIAHVGDGRIFLFRGKEAHQLSEDHSLVQQQLREGLITPEEAKRARFRNVVTRALGVFPSVKVDTLHFEAEVGDRIAVCTDGLHRYIGLRELSFTLNAEVDENTPGKLVNLANVRGGRDNITLAVIRVDGDDENQEPTGRQRLDVLRKIDLFQYCTYRELMAVHAMATERMAPADTTLFREGDKGRELFILLEGQVSIEKDNTQLVVVEAPGHFGEMSFIDEPTRSASARTLTDAHFLVIQRDQFLLLMKRDSELATKVMWRWLVKLSRSLRETNERAVADSILLDESLEIVD